MADNRDSAGRFVPGQSGNPKTCALCGKSLESGKCFYVSVRAGLKETLICKDCLKDRKDDKTEKKYGRAC